MFKAIEAVVNEAAKSYNVPPTTLKNRLRGRVKHGTKPGPQSYLTTIEENEFLVKACKMGNGKTKREVIQGVKRMAEKKVDKVVLNLMVD